MIKIAIDAGHGSNTPGKRTAPFKKNVDVNKDGKPDVMKGEQYREHIANVGIANLLYTELKSRGYEVMRTGWNGSDATNDQDESLTSRQQKIKKAKCDISVSIHFNAIGDGKSFNSASGVGIYIHDKHANDSRKLATSVLGELVKGSKQNNRGISPQSLALCNCSRTGTKASILIECAFMTNEHEAQGLMANQRYWVQTAIEIADGIDKYFK